MSPERPHIAELAAVRSALAERAGQPESMAAAARGAVGPVDYHEDAAGQIDQFLV